jgi:uncharacterized membrane-anchored protein YhcB (DUF1043 family)
MHPLAASFTLFQHPTEGIFLFVVGVVIGMIIMRKVG